MIWRLSLLTVTAIFTASGCTAGEVDVADGDVVVINSPDGGPSNGTGDLDGGATTADSGGDSEDTGPDGESPTPGSCDYEPVPATDPEPGVMAGMTAEHNRWRARVGVPPLTWSEDLAASSTAYAEGCVWGHDESRSPDGGFSYVGENIAGASGQPTNAGLVDAVTRWASERADYDFGAVTGQVAGVGHYTQIVWEQTTTVGCGYAHCPSLEGIDFNGTFVVCRYGPGGNFTGQAPYGQSEGACLDLDNDDVWQRDDADDTDRTVQ